MLVALLMPVQRIPFQGWAILKVVECMKLNQQESPTALYKDLVSSSSSSPLPPLPHPMLSFNLEPSNLEGSWCAHPRRARADSQLVVERQYHRSLSCKGIAEAPCLVTGGVSGQYSVTKFLGTFSFL